MLFAINLFLAITVTCLNYIYKIQIESMIIQRKTYIYIYICLTLNYHTFNLNFIYLHVTLMVCLKENVLLRTIKYYLILILSSESREDCVVEVLMTS